MTADSHTILYKPTLTLKLYLCGMVYIQYINIIFIMWNAACDFQINPDVHTHAGHAHYIHQSQQHMCIIGHRKCSGHGGLSAIHDLLLASLLSTQAQVFICCLQIQFLFRKAVYLSLSEYICGFELEIAFYNIKLYNSCSIWVSGVCVYLHKSVSLCSSLSLLVQIHLP